MSEKYLDKNKELIRNNAFYEHVCGIIYMNKNENGELIVNTVNGHYFKLGGEFSKDLSLIANPQDKIKELEQISEWMKEKLKNRR